jgi:ankyrin repeat protein
MIEAGADVNIRDRFGQTPLMWTAMAGQDKVAQVLLDRPVI